MSRPPVEPYQEAVLADVRRALALPAEFVPGQDGEPLNRWAARAAIAAVAPLIERQVAERRTQEIVERLRDLSAGVGSPFYEAASFIESEFGGDRV